MNTRLLYAAILLASPLASHPAHAQATPNAPAKAPQVLAAPPAQGAELQSAAIASLSALARFFDADRSEDALSPLWPAQGRGDEWSKLVATSRAARLPFVLRRIKARELDKFGPLLARLKVPHQIVLVQAASHDNLLLFVNGRDVLMPRRDFERRFSGDALSIASPSALRIQEPVREIWLRSIGGSDEIVQSIRLSNASGRPLAVKVASTSCGCTGASVSPSVLAPHSSGVLTARMHASDSRLVTVNLQSGDAQSPSSTPWAVVALQTRAPQAQLPPTVLLNAARGEVASTSTVVQLPRGARLMKILVREPWLSVVARPAPAADPKQASALSMEVKLSNQAPAGRFESALRLRLQGGEVEELVVPLSGMVSDDVLAEPSALVLGERAAGLVVRKTIIVRGPRPFSMTSAGGGERVSVGADPQVLARTHAVEISTRIEGEAGSSQHERATLSLSDGRSLDVDIFASVAAAGSVSDALAQVPEVQIGAAAPDFELRDQDGVLRKLSDLKGKRALLLTFFPRCFSGGCAGQLASLQRERPNFERLHIAVWAISTDGMEGERGLRAFAGSLGLSFPLLSDESRQVCALYGAAASRDDLARRQSIFIDASGVVRLIERDVRVETHGRDVLARLQEMKLLP